MAENLQAFLFLSFCHDVSATELAECAAFHTHCILFNSLLSHKNHSNHNQENVGIFSTQFKIAPVSCTKLILTSTHFITGSVCRLSKVWVWTLTVQVHWLENHLSVTHFFLDLLSSYRSNHRSFADWPWWFFLCLLVWSRNLSGASLAHQPHLYPTIVGWMHLWQYINSSTWLHANAL